MKKNQISYDELVVGLMLKFGSIDASDISVVMDMMKIENFSSVNESGFGKYIKRNDDNRFEFDIDMIKRNYERVDDFYLVARTFQGNIVKEFLENIDLFEFVLRKIKVLGNIKVDNYSRDFSSLQRFVINELKNQKYLYDYWYDFNDECMSTMLTVGGDLYLFKIDYKVVIDRFSKKLRDNGYNDMLLDAYLVSHRFDIDIEYIEKNVMNIEHFLEFCDIYEINPCLECKNIFEDKDGYKKVKNL